MASLATPRSIRHDIEESHVATRRRRRATVGLETGVYKMKKGERAELSVDPKYGFGKDGLKSKVRLK